MILFEKWHPDSSNCAFQYYFYNNVPPEHVPYYGPAPGEDEKKWEEALSKKPSEGSIPVVGKGFRAIGERLGIQVAAVSALQTRLHEINNSLSAMMQNHDLVISVRAADARRKHAALSQRCLRLAAKVQTLRNRGYAMDNAEEELRKKLGELEKGAFDPVLNGRQEEVWARMSGVRARARFLQEEFEKTGRAMAESDEEIIDEDNMKVVKKVSRLRLFHWQTLMCGRYLETTMPSSITSRQNWTRLGRIMMRGSQISIPLQMGAHSAGSSRVFNVASSTRTVFGHTLLRVDNPDDLVVHAIRSRAYQDSSYDTNNSIR